MAKFDRQSTRALSLGEMLAGVEPAKGNAPEVEIPKEIRGDAKKTKEFLDKLAKDKTMSQNFSKNDRLSRLEKYEDADRKNPRNKVFIAEEQFKGPLVKRRTTDFLWMGVLLGLGFLYGFYALWVINEGSPKRLDHSHDFRAELCGLGKLAKKNFQYFLNPSVDQNVVMCVDHCPALTGDTICLYGTDGKATTPFCYVTLQTTYMGKYCLPVEPISRVVVNNYLSSFEHIFKRIASDLILAQDTMLVGCAISAALSFLLLILLRQPIFVEFLVWFSILGSLGAFGFLTWSCTVEYKRTIQVACLNGVDAKGCGGMKAAFYWYGALIIALAGFLYLLTIARLIRRIRLAIGIIQASSKSFVVLSQIKLVPLVLCALTTALAAVMVQVVFNAASVGEIRLIPAKAVFGNFVKTIFLNPFARSIAIGNVLLFFWWILCFLSFGDLLIAYALSIWFFTKRKSSVVLPLFRAFKDVVRYHLGTTVMNATLSFIFGIPASMLGIIRSQMRTSSQNSSSVRFTMALCMFCVHLYEVFLRYLSKHALVQTAIYSLPYLTASQQAYFLLFRNRAKYQDLDFLQSFVVVQTKLLVAMAGAIFVYAYVIFFPTSLVWKYDLTGVETPFAPMIFVFIAGYFYGSIFQGSLDIACKTILQCYFMDEEMFVGEQRFVEDFIREFMEYFNKQSVNKNRNAGVNGLERKATLQVNLEDMDAEDERKNAILEGVIDKSDEDKDSEDSDDDIETVTEKKSVAASAVQVKGKPTPKEESEESEDEEIEEISLAKNQKKAVDVEDDDDDDEDDDEDDDDDEEDEEDDDDEEEEESEEEVEEKKVLKPSPSLPIRANAPVLHRSFSPTLSPVSRRKEEFQIGQTIKLQKLEESANVSQSINSFNSSIGPGGFGAGNSPQKSQMLLRDASYQSIGSPSKPGTGQGYNPIFNRSRINLESSSMSIEESKDNPK